ncbi:MAG: glycosyltransferase [Bryobacteraceae bacterium]|nr:glycosyltransferase [Bryobacteraceae bacterium]
MLPTLRRHDAVGNDALGMLEILRAAGYQALLFAEIIDDALKDLAIPASADLEFWRSPIDVLIYHHAIHWELGEKILARSRNRLVIKYHNVTPPHFYADYSTLYYRACEEGLAATAALAKFTRAVLWADSQFNAGEFTALGFPEARCRVLPPVHQVEELTQQPLDPIVMGAYRGPRPNVLFVGGMRPNKGHFRAIETFVEYAARTDRQPRLIFAGSFDPGLVKYTDALERHVHNMHLEDSVVFARSVSASQLRAYYTSASAFLCVSEHEGFCVPLIEAMAFRVPLVAWGTTAVGETAASCGYVFSSYDAMRMAEALDSCVEDMETTRSLIGQARRRYESSFHPNAIRARLLELTGELERL